LHGGQARVLPTSLRVTATAALAGAGAAALLAWLGVLLRPSRAWDLRPVAEDEPAPPEPAAWPAVCALVPARNERACLPRTLPALQAQDYPGQWRIALVDDRSQDGTAEVARGLAGPTTAVVEGGPLPAGWAGKVWALEQAVRAAGAADYLLLTDADILHAAGSLRRLVAESEAAGLALNSRMARLHAASAAERLLVPPFLFFFNLLYPMRLVNAGRIAAAAGGCALLRRDALERAGGLASIRAAVIDDISLARAVRRAGGRLRLSVSRQDVVSLREYGSLGAFWRTVRRTAFTELRHSWPRLALTVAALALLFGAPPALLGAAAAGQPLPALLGAAAWAAMTLAFAPTVRFFGLPLAWALSLPVAGVLYGAMTVDSALRHAAGRRGAW
jgi:hopene-associated glycosyltransferase HpnB